jgi:hypothetical protein
MNGKTIFAIAGLAFMFGAGSALAQDEDGTEATMSLMEHLDDKLPDAVINDIALPEHLMSGEGEDLTAAETNSDKGIMNANTNRDKREDGLGIADAASQHGFDMREAAEENRANLGRAEGNSPDTPDVPEPPAPPGPPGGS